jgi:periplasmic divalent cation tolerance protein
MQRIVLSPIKRLTGINSEMKSAHSFAIVFATAPDLKVARAMANAALKSKLIACANLIPKIESHYRWQGKIESSAEVLMILKTRKSKLAALEKLILAKHPYDTPEFLVLPMTAGNKKYLDWIGRDGVSPSQ